MDFVGMPILILMTQLKRKVFHRLSMLSTK